MRQRAEQALVVALVQADRRLVEDVHDTDQTRTDLARKPDALRLTTGQGFGTSIERQVVEADIRQETDAVANLLDDFVGDCGPPTFEL